MKTVKKYILKETESYITMHEDAELLHVNMQDGKICVWALVDDELQIKNRLFKILTEGELLVGIQDIVPIYIGSVYVSPQMLHVFDIGQMEIGMDGNLLD